MLISWQKMKWSLGEWQGPECETLQECGGSDQGELDLEESIRVMNTCPWSVGSQGGSSLVHFTCSDMSDCLWPHGLQHARLPCPSPTIGAYSNSCWSSQWCHPTISSFIIPFSSCLQSFPASGSFPMSQLFTSSGQRIGVSALASVHPVNIQDKFT